MSTTVQEVAGRFHGDIGAFLTRIGLPSVPEPPTLDYLRKVTAAACRNISFETLDCHLRNTENDVAERITPDLDKVFRKVVVARRGGFCMEVNVLMSWALQALGFHVTTAPTEVHGFEHPGGTTGDKGRTFVHYLNIVTFDGSETEGYVVEAGFLPLLGFPLMLKFDAPIGVRSEPQEDPSDGYLHAYTRLEPDDGVPMFLLERQSVGLPGLGGVVSEPGTWEPRQTLKVKPGLWSTLKDSSLNIVLDSPQSFFNHAAAPEIHRVVIALKDERVQYLFLNRALITTVHPKFHEPSSDPDASVFRYLTKTVLADEAEYRAKLTEITGITWPDSLHTELFSDSTPEM